MSRHVHSVVYLMSTWHHPCHNVNRLWPTCFFQICSQWFFFLPPKNSVKTFVLWSSIGESEGGISTALWVCQVDWCQMTSVIARLLIIFIESLTVSTYFHSPLTRHVWSFIIIINLQYYIKHKRKDTLEIAGYKKKKYIHFSCSFFLFVSHNTCVRTHGKPLIRTHVSLCV